MSKVFAFLKDEFRRHGDRIRPHCRGHFDRDRCISGFSWLCTQYHFLNRFHPTQISYLSDV